MSCKETHVIQQNQEEQDTNKMRCGTKRNPGKKNQVEIPELKNASEMKSAIESHI